jgi:hypothetical protein
VTVGGTKPKNLAGLVECVYLLFGQPDFERIKLCHYGLSRKHVLALQAGFRRGRTDRGDAQSWYFLGLPLGLDVFPGMSGAGSTKALGEAEASAGVEAGLMAKVERVGPKEGGG